MLHIAEFERGDLRLPGKRLGSGRFQSDLTTRKGGSVVLARETGRNAAFPWPGVRLSFYTYPAVR